MEIKELILVGFLGFLMSIPLAICVNELVKWDKDLKREEEKYRKLKETKENRR